MQLLGIGDVTQKIEDQERIPKKKQKLGFNDSFPLDDEKCLDDYEVPDGDVLDVNMDEEEDTMKVSVMVPKRKPFSMSCNSKDTVEQLKDATEEEQGIPAKQQRLLFTGLPLANAQQLKAYCLPPNAAMNLTEAGRQSPKKAFAKPEKGKPIASKVNPDNIEDVKTKIQDKAGTLADDAVPNEGTLDVVVGKPMNINVKQDDVMNQYH